MTNNIYIKVNSDQTLLLDNIISGMLPHEHFNIESFSSVLMDFFDIIKSEELYGFYLIIYRFLERGQKYAVLRKTTPITLNRDNFDRALSDSIELFIKSSEFDADRFFSEYGLNYNLDIPKELNSAIDSAYTILLEKYDSLFELKFKTEDISNELVTLSQSLEIEYCILASQVGADILANGVNERGVTYTGAAVFKSNVRSILDMIDMRFSLEDKTMFNKTHILNDYQSRELYMEQNKVQIAPLFQSSIQPIANMCTYRTQDIVTVVANEGTGKTTFGATEIYAALIQGNNVLALTGETATAKFVAMLESIHMFRAFGIRLTIQEIMDGLETIQDSPKYSKERIKEMFNAAKIDFYENPSHGKLVVANSFSYATFDTELRNQMQQLHCSVILVDHVAAMDKTMTPQMQQLRLYDDKSRIDYLIGLEDKLVKQHNCMFINMCHTNNDTEKALTKERSVGSRITAGSGNTSKYSTHIWLLSQNSALLRNNRIMVELNKVRDYEHIEPFILDRELIVPLFTYDSSHQLISDDSDIDVEELID